MGTETHDQDLHPGVDPDALAEAKALVGTRMRTNEEGLRRRHSWNREATVDNIRHFVNGYGDDNPLYTDPTYARGTRWGNLVAPPTWLWTVDTGIVAPKLSGLQWIQGGKSIAFERPVVEGDRFHVEVTLTDVEKKVGETVGEMVIQTGEVKFYDQTDNLVATQTGTTLRVPRRRTDASNGGSDGRSNEDDSESPSGKKLPFTPTREPAVWSESEIREFENQALSQSRRGAEPRYWESVSTGARLEPRLKGPLSMTDILCWYMGWGAPAYRAHELFVKERLRHPSEAYIRENGVVEHPAMGHLDPEVATGVGIPRPYDISSQRQTWLLQTVTDWMGNNGFLASFGLRVERLNFLGDVVWCKGEVTDTYVDNGDHLVDIDLWGENQDDLRVASGSATVQLPTTSE